MNGFRPRKLWQWGGASLLACMVMASCGGKHKGAPELRPSDPSKPVTITEFYPDSGGLRTKFILKGSNFGTIKDSLHLFFEQVNPVTQELESTPAVVINSVDDVLYALVPKLQHGATSVRLKVGDKEATFGLEDGQKTYKYLVAKTVSTVVGLPKKNGNKNGTLAEAQLSWPRYVLIDDKDNLLVFEWQTNNNRYVDIKGNKVSAISKAACGQGIADAERKNFWVPQDQTRPEFFQFSQETGYVLERKGKITNEAVYLHSVTFGPEENKDWFYSRKNTGQMIRFPRKEGNKQIHQTEVQELGVIGLDNGGQNGHIVYNPHDGYFYCTVHRNNALFRIKVTLNAEDPSAKPTADIKLISKAEPGYNDGVVDFTGEGDTEVRFKEPRGVALDSKGNLYIADYGNHCIRMLNTKSGVLTTVAGVPKKAGHKDGDPDIAQFNGPWGLYMDQNDMLYICDLNNHCVRRLAIE